MSDPIEEIKRAQTEAQLKAILRKYPEESIQALVAKRLTELVKQGRARPH